LLWISLYFSQTLKNNHKLVTIPIFAFLKYDKNDFISFLENIHEKNFLGFGRIQENQTFF
jgi:hypothetical protein